MGPVIGAGWPIRIQSLVLAQERVGIKDDPTAAAPAAPIVLINFLRVMPFLPVTSSFIAFSSFLVGLCQEPLRQMHALIYFEIENS
jgi:hypothetical protein